MTVGQKVSYNERTYVVASNTDGMCDIVEEGSLSTYVASGLDMRGSDLRIFTAPDGSNVIIDPDGKPVGYSDVNEKDLVDMGGRTAVFGAAAFDDGSIFA